MFKFISYINKAEFRKKIQSKMVSNNAELLKKFCIRLYEINALKFGDFEMKVGLRSPIYFDLRVIISYPDVMVNEF